MPPLGVQIQVFRTSSPTTSHAGLLSGFICLKKCQMVSPHVAHQQCHPFSSSAYSPRFQKFLKENLKPNSRPEQELVSEIASSHSASPSRKPSPLSPGPVYPATYRTPPRGCPLCSSDSVCSNSTLPSSHSTAI